MKNKILYSIITIFLFALFISSSHISAQTSLKLKATKTPFGKSEISFYDLKDYTLYQIDGKAILKFAQKQKDQTFILHLNFGEDHNWEMQLQPAKLHGPDYKAVTNTGEEIELEKDITFKGYLKNDPAVKVRMTISENLIYGLIFDKKMHSFETVTRNTNRSSTDLMAVYNASEIPQGATKCGHATNQEKQGDQRQMPHIPSMEENGIFENIDVPDRNTETSHSRFVNTYCPIIGVTLDWQALDLAGSVAQFNSDLQTILNVANGYHDNEFSVEFSLSPLYVISSAPNPWPDNSCCNGSSNHGNYQDWAEFNYPYPYTVTMLFTGQDFNSTSWGSVGNMCTPRAAIQMDYFDNITPSHRGNVAAHEIGHVWGAQHGSTSQQYIMSPSVYPGTLQWTSTTTNVINSKINEINTCLPSCSGGGGGNGWIASTVIRGPYLQSGTPTSSILKWRTANSIDSKVWYGTSVGVYDDSVSVSGNVTDHEVFISGLIPNTTYYYAIGESGGKMEGGNDGHYFTTSPNAGTSQPITAWILGDCGTANNDQRAVRDAYYNYIGNDHTDMILLLGDNAYDDGWDAEYQNAIFNIYPEKLKNTMLWSCPGNHDYYGQGGLNADYYDIFTFPTSGEAGGYASNTEKYYSFDYGNLHIISLDSYDEDRDPGSPMLTWLENDLAATSQEWIVVIFHHPPYSKGSHDSDNTGEYRMIEMRENILPICEDYGVDLVLSGHSHAYERSKLINGHYGFSGSYNPSTHDIDGGDGRTDGDGAYQQNGNEEGTVYIVTGSAGKLSGVGSHPIMYYSLNRLGSTILEVNGGQMDVKFLNSNGVVEDYLTLLQNGTPTVSWTNPYDGQVFTDLSTITFTASASDSDGSVTQVEFFVEGVSIGTDNTAPYSVNWTPTSFNNYTLKAEVTDNDGKTNSKEIDITVQDGISIDINIQVNNNNDDAEERVSDGVMNVTSSDLEIADESGSIPQEVGMRFNNVNVPPGATITNAYIQFTVDETDSGSTNLTIYGQAHDNPATFSTGSYNISSRAKTSSSVNWNPAAWNTVGASGANQQTPNLNSIVQEIIDRPGWTVNNSMVLIINGSGERTAESYEGSVSGAPTLHISYTQPNGNKPTVNWTSPTDNQTFTSLASIGLSANASDSDGSIDQVEFFVNGSSVGIDNSAPYSVNWTPPAYGSYTLTTTATDNDGNTDSDEITISVQNGTTTNISVQINHDDDDVEEREGDGTIINYSSDLELVYDSWNSQNNQTVGLRFNNLNIPQGAVITDAHIHFTADESDSGSTSLTIWGEDQDNSSAFSTTDYDVSSRNTTSASVNWNPTAWNSGDSGSAQESPNLSTIVQEIVNRSGWTANNSMSFIITGSGTRIADSHDGSPSTAPILHVTFSVGNSCDPYTDNDNDGHCSDVDCDDNDASIHPGATEVCDGIDNDCDGQVDEGLTNTYYADNDGDGYGDPNDSTVGCNPPNGYVSNNTDCDDSDVNINPGMSELCDGADNNCNGQVDEGITSTYYADNDGDGYGDANISATTCDPPAGYVLNNSDCDDNNAGINPGVSEICDGIDNNCDGQIDEGVINTYFADTDGDGYGDPNNSTQACSAPTGYISDDSDCNDTNSAINPAATEICDGIDNNCNGQVDEVTCVYCTPIHTGSENELITNVTVGTINNSSGGWNTSTTGYSDYTHISTEADIGTNYNITVTPNYSWADSKLGIWADWDQDLVFDANEAIASLSGAGPWTASFTPPAGAVLGTTRLRIRLQYGSGYIPDPCAGSPYYSGETEDYNLDVVDCSPATYFADTDGDGYGDPAVSILACTQPSGYVADNTDCDDNNANVYPTASCNDGDPLTNNDQYDANCVCAGTNNPNNTIISSSINTSSDDVEEVVSSGYIHINSNDLEMVTDGGSILQNIGLRFNSINIPQGATIHYAYIQFTADESDSGSTSLNIRGHDIDNAPTFQNVAYDVSDRPTTNASINWNPNVWNAGDAGVAQQTPNLNIILQEIVNRAGWEANNSIAFILSGSGNREADSYDGSASNAAKLYIEYDPSCAIDVDGDGICVNLDCDDNDANNTGQDADSDGVCTPLDCNDNDPSIYPGAPCDDGDPDTINDAYNGSCICECAPNPVITLEVSITNGNDDVEEKESNGWVYMPSSDLEMVYDSWNNMNNQTVGLRFNGLTIPNGATVTNAYIQFTADASDSGSTDLDIHGHDHNNAPAFQNVDYDVSGRTATTASVNWIPASWSSGDVGTAQQTPDLKNIVQEIIDRPGWNSGNSMVFIVSGTGTREADSYEGGASKAPVLHVEYTNPPTPNISGNDNYAGIISQQSVQVSEGEILIYPNPAYDVLTVAYNTSEARKTIITFFNMIGQPVIQKPIEVTDGTNLINVDLSHLTNGIYLLNIKEAKRSLTARIIISK